VIFFGSNQGTHTFPSKSGQEKDGNHVWTRTAVTISSGRLQSTVDGYVSIGDNDGTYFSDYQPCRIVSIVNVAMFGEEHKEFVAVYNDKKGKEQRLMTRLGDHIVRNKILVREFKTLFKEYEETLSKAWSLANELVVVERRLRRYPITEEEVAGLITLVNKS
jgi:hypothetical protein